MLEPHFLGVHGRGPSVFRCKHRFGAAMEGAGLSDFTHEPLLGLFPSCVLPKNNDLMSHSCFSSLHTRSKPYHTCIL